MKGNIKDEKREIRFFTVAEWRKEEDYLRKQHLDGWKLEKAAFPCFYYFKRAEKEDVIYQLDYNPDADLNKGEYIQMFRDCGWEYIQDMAGYSYFRKPASQMKGKEEIFCDEESRIDMIKRVFRGRLMPLVCIFFLCICPNIYVQFNLDDPISKGLLCFFIVLFFLYLLIFLHCAVQFYKFIRSVKK